MIEAVEEAEAQQLIEDNQAAVEAAELVKQYQEDAE